MSIETKKHTKEISGIFVGNQMSFSDTVMGLAETEMPCLGFKRVASLNEPLFMDEAQAKSVRVIIVDDSLIGDMLKAMPQLNATFPQANIVLAYRSPETTRKLIKDHKDIFTYRPIGFLPMNLQIDSWLSVLRLLVYGENYMPSELFSQGTEVRAAELDSADEVANESAAGEATTNSPDAKIHLTERELQVLQYAAEGKQNKIIADELNLSQHTVKLHMHHVIAKLGLHNRTEAAIWYLGQCAEK